MLIVNGWVVIFDFDFILFLTTFFLLKGGLTTLHCAAREGFEQIVKILIEHGSNVDLQDTVFIFFFYLLLWFIVGLFEVDCEWLGCDIWFCFYFF